MTEPAALEVFQDPVQAAVALARRILDGVQRARTESRRYLLGCPGGRSAAEVYAALAQQVARDEIPLDHLVIVMMDEYVLQQGSSPRPVADDLPHSCRRFGRVEIVQRLNAGTPAPIPDDQFWVPDPACPADYERLIVDAGGIDHFILASGSGDGHVAFNGPGSGRDSRTRVVELAEQTRRDNLRTFPSFAGLDAVPRHGVTVGIATIVEQSAAATLVIHGAEKRQALARILAVDDYDPTWPASVVHACRQATVLTDVSTLENAVELPATAPIEQPTRQT